ncbi:tyrosine-protein phosphatase [Enterococcus crotali]|uniref:tyrosine-protein phosphatase n=1 Tax=Enterococcus crotali TaxID=1453587 RepID=UPI00046F43B4|nr:tyrosine-protein phosphatase [Enterococcus crotali]
MVDKKDIPEKFAQPYTIEGVSLERVDDCVHIHFSNPKRELIEIFYSNHPVERATFKLLIEGKTEAFDTLLPRSQGPYYFFAIIKGQHTPIFGERILPLTGTINLRDLGGYTIDQGQRVKWGQLYRSDHLTKLTEEDIIILERIGIKTVIDLRSDHEKTVYPNQKIPTVEYLLNCNPESHFAELAGNAINLEAENKKLIDDIENGDVDASVVNGSGLVSIRSYESFVEDQKSQKAFGEMVKWLADPKSIASIHHCRGGKDRTGFGSMLILALLGVNEEQIMKDYLITKTVREERNLIKLRQYQMLTDNQDYLDYLMALIDTRKDYLTAAMTKIKEEYGGIVNYATNYLGVSLVEIAQMKKLYLEPID